MASSEIIGHTAQRANLLEDLQSGNVAHAYLFSGPRHLGKMTIARWFASELINSGRSEDEQEIARQQIEKLMHPDVLVLDKLWIEEESEDWDDIALYSNAPQTHRAKKPAAKTDTISIDDIRALQERLYDTGSGTYRVCIVRSVERMQDAAANAFLKILEEPPTGLIFLLTTQAQSALLPTIISRARVLQFRTLPNKELRPLLSGVSEDDAKFILHVAHGAPGIICALRDDPDALREHRQVHSNAQSFWRTASVNQRMQFLKPLQERTEEADDLLLHLALTLRERSPHIPSGHTEALQQLAEGLKTNAHRGLLLQRFTLSIV